MFTRTTKFTMKFSKLLLIAAALCAVSVISCKKDPENETLPYLTGEPEFYLPPYCEAGETFSFTAKGVTDDDGNPVNYYWSASPVITKRDTSLTFSFTVPDTLCTITVTCGAFEEGYYGSITTKSTSVIKCSRENGSLTGILFDAGKDFVFKDARDGHEYWCTTVGDKDWFKENLAYEHYGKPIDNCLVTSGLFGMFYSWEEAVAACPDGWRVSSLQDWADAAKAMTGTEFDTGNQMYSVAGDFMGDIYFNGSKMWDYWPDVKITNKGGLCMMPLGYAVIGDNGNASFESLNGYAVFWTGDEKDESQAYYRYIYEEKPDVCLGASDKKSFAASVRCVRDHQED